MKDYVYDFNTQYTTFLLLICQCFLEEKEVYFIISFIKSKFGRKEVKKMENLTLNLEFSNSDDLISLLKKAQSDAEVLKLDVEAIKNFKIAIN